MMMKKNAVVLLLCGFVVASAETLPWNLAHFDASFEWGTATAAYQIEGAALEDGRGPSIWDTFSHTKGKTTNGDTGDVADDFYHRFKDDVDLMSSLGLTHYRMSLSWSRLLPNGTVAEQNADGVRFYRDIFAALREKRIEPLVTLYHWDLPQALEEKYRGWLSSESVSDFANYADFAFATFPEVDKWITFNEALTFIGEGYTDGIFAPGRCADRGRCAEGDSASEPFLAGHNVLLAHAAAVARFRDRFPPKDDHTTKKEIGMTNCGWMMWPLYEDDDPQPAQDLMEGMWAWFTDPIIVGDYPDSIKKRAGRNLPEFTPEESAMLAKSIDFLGVNYYSARYVATPDASHPPAKFASGVPMIGDSFSVLTEDDRGNALGPRGGSDWLYVVPEGLRDLLVWLDRRYGGEITMRITENGCSQPATLDATPELAVNDTFRIDYLKTHVAAIGEAIADHGVDVVGYYAWSFMDNYEWADGYSKRFGLVFVDFATLERIPKQSAYWYESLVRASKSNFSDSVVSAPRMKVRHKKSRPHPLAAGVPLALASAVVFGILMRRQRRPPHQAPPGETDTLLRRASSSSSSSSAPRGRRGKKTKEIKVQGAPPTPRIGRRPRSPVQQQAGGRSPQYVVDTGYISP